MTTNSIQLLREKAELSFARRGLAWGGFTGALWGLDGVLLGIVLGMAPFNDAKVSMLIAPIVAAAIHDGFAALWLFIINISSGKFREFRRTLATRPGKVVCIAALCGGPIGMTGYLLGINHAGPAYAMSISAIYPALGSVCAMFFLKERISPRAWAGIALSVTGAIIVGWQPPSGNAPHFYLGVAFACMAAVGWGLESVLSTYGMDLIDPDIAINIREAVSFLAYMIIIVPAIGGMGFLAAAVPEKTTLLIAATALAGGLSYFSWYRAMNMTGVGRAMALSVTYVIWSIVYSVVLTRLGLMEFRLTPFIIGGAAAITTGTLLIISNPGELLKLRNN